MVIQKKKSCRTFWCWKFNIATQEDQIYLGLLSEKQQKQSLVVVKYIFNFLVQIFFCYKPKFKNYFFTGSHGGKNYCKKKNPPKLKEVLLNFLRESDAVEQQEFKLHNIIDQREEDIDIIKHYQEIIMTGNEKSNKI